ncbi:MAG: hypothetical protein KatS3mg110_1844 [Pirellulaceae bacterium]|nr:MAG: hypothetical protein KatS3mg110_1844 [Pirellulaceae bacterium]
MGRLRFTIPADVQLPAIALETVYMAGMDDVPWLCHVALVDRCLSVVRPNSDSGSLRIAWPTSRGCYLLRTASLPEREEPYRLDIELARGTVSRIREFLAQAHWAGCSIPDAVTDTVRRAESHFLDAVVMSRSSERDSWLSAQQAIEASLSIAEPLVQSVVDIALAARRQHARQLPTLLVGRLEELPINTEQESQFLETFNVAAVPAVWKRLQTETGQWQWSVLDQRLHWCHQRGLRVGVGPLLSPNRDLLPDWLFLWQEDFDQLRQTIVEYLEQLVRHCRGRVHYWHVASAMNLPGDLQLGEEDRVRLLVAAIDAVRRADGQTPMIVTFDQPWAQYLAHSPGELSPLYFAEMLVRGDLGLAGIGLELQLGCWPGSGPPCDLLELARLLDQWSALNFPLLVVLTVPGGSGPDPNCWQSEVQTVWGNFKPSADSQRHWLEQLVPLLLAQPSVHGILFNQCRDSQPHRIPHGGLWDLDDQPKPALDVLRKLRAEWLG